MSITIYNENTLREKSFAELQDRAAFELSVAEINYSLNDQNRYICVPLSPSQKAHWDIFLQQIPQQFAATRVGTAYRVMFPKGLPHTLIQLQQGGFGSMIQQTGSFVGSASFYPMLAEGAALSAFSVLSAVTGQYFLNRINRELTMVNKELNDILSFLYGEKKAELLAEVNFVRYAQANFGTIMLQEGQRNAVLLGLQEAKRISIKDMEFYISDMERVSSEQTGEFDDFLWAKQQTLRARDCVELSSQLYATSSILEMCYSQNFDTSYVEYVRNELDYYIERSDIQIQTSCLNLFSKISNSKRKRSDREISTHAMSELLKVRDYYKHRKDSPARIAFNETLDSIIKPVEYIIDSEGNLYQPVLENHTTDYNNHNEIGSSLNDHDIIREFHK